MSLSTVLPSRKRNSVTKSHKYTLDLARKNILILHLASLEARAEEDEALVEGVLLLYSHFHT